jgi:Tfp pilus assembly protein PilN
MRRLARIALDHVRAPTAAPRQLAAIGLLALVTAVLGALRLADLREEEHALQVQYQRGAPRAQALPQPARHAPSEAFAAAPPWDRLFGALELAAGGDVSLIGLDPAPERRQLRLEGEARNLEALLGYMRRVGATPPFVRAQLQSHQASTGDRQHPVRFTLELSWRERP